MSSPLTAAAATLARSCRFGRGGRRSMASSSRQRTPDHRRKSSVRRSCSSACSTTDARPARGPSPAPRPAADHRGGPVAPARAVPRDRGPGANFGRLGLGRGSMRPAIHLSDRAHVQTVSRLAGGQRSLPAHPSAGVFQRLHGGCCSTAISQAGRRDQAPRGLPSRTSDGCRRPRSGCGHRPSSSATTTRSTFSTRTTMGRHVEAVTKSESWSRFATWRNGARLPRRRLQLLGA